MPHRFLVLLLVGLAALAVACGDSSGSTTTNTSNPGPADVKLALDWYPNPDHVGIFAGMDRGDFAARGMHLTLVAPSDVSDPIKLVAAKRVDLGVSYEPEVFFASQKHIPVVAVAALVPTALNSIIARTDRGIHQISDLRGKTIGVDGSASTTAYVKTMLQTSGVPIDSVHLVTVGFNLVPALLSGRADAIAGGFQNIEGIDIRAHGVATTVFPVDHYGVPSYDELVIVANRDRMQSDAGYRSLVKNFVTALTEATTWARNHPAAAIAIMRKQSSRDYRGEIAKSVPATLKLLETSRLNPAAWAAFGTWMWSRGLLDVKPDGAALVTQP